jgi:hypothetical protein
MLPDFFMQTTVTGFQRMRIPLGLERPRPYSSPPNRLRSPEALAKLEKLFVDCQFVPLRLRNRLLSELRPPDLSPLSQVDRSSINQQLFCTCFVELNWVE